MIWRGIAIGIIISAPMGPVGILCVQRTLEKGRRTGFFTGIGAAISDMFYCVITGFGLSFIEDFLTRNHDIIQLIGSVVLIGFGIYLFKSNPTRNLKKPEEGISDRRNILNGFLFTFSNPLIIFLIIGLFARFNFLVPEIQAYHYFIGFISIGAGALVWWWVVTYFVAKLRSHFNLRSMWLINKIIGGIILIFAIVGIVTAISAIASAASRHPAFDTPLYLNSSRGFGNFNHAADSTLIIEAYTNDTVCDLIAIPAHVDFNVSFRATNLHNKSGKGYAIKGGPKQKNPGWGIVLADKSGKREIISIRTLDNIRDETYSSPQLLFSRSPGNETNRITNGMDLFTGTNSFHLNFIHGNISLSGGNREYKPIMSFESSIEYPDSFGFFVAPGAMLSLDHIILSPESCDDLYIHSEFGNPDVLSSYLNRSRNKMEGIWKIWDRSLEEDYLRMGGDYECALIENEDGYDLIYLDGARTEARSWRSGMIKARLKKTSFKDIFDVEWIDSSRKKLPDEIKASLDGGILTITFPYQSSVLRLRKIHTPK
ncbi:MAG: LysE family translocator [Muribaculaceae bacterium]|nr:LysE family translocator [Muribaculaceae bacterium]